MVFFFLKRNVNLSYSLELSGGEFCGRRKGDMSLLVCRDKDIWGSFH